jgi:CrcB protein
MKSIIVIGIGGLIGSTLRYLTALWLTKLIPTAFPYGTFAVNIIGCLAIGIIYGLAEAYTWLTPEWRLFFATGVIGGFTTFSSFIYENTKLLQQGNYLVFALYSITSFVLGLLAVFIGLIIIKK